MGEADAATAKPSIHVHLLPELIPPGALQGGVAVVLDVLRATTVMVQALASGCTEIIPCLEIEDARRMAAGLPFETTLLAGERHGLPIEGFDLGNSPGDYTQEVCEGKTLVMTTTNGTKAILACLEAERVLVASFANTSATWQILDNEVKRARPIHIVCAGTEGEISLEDTMLAGDLVYWTAGFLGGVRHWSDAGKKLACNDAALIACASASDNHTNDYGPKVRESILRKGKGGRRVTEIGLAADIKHAAGTKRLNVVAEVLRKPVRIIRAS